eukprot:TRINITY_DN85199_c0_g1_i1.p1 TRINITY_DN85199_c0_g1~~TRINITY_DN85199_c0_g1_i1.p1  ORF type:complete len:146 (+),score=7.80 TRINITY_DN85199_c0_g1_i1:55-438(+)
MVAGGTGIAPIYKILREALADPLDGTNFSLVSANCHESDILLRRELMSFARMHRDRFRVTYCLSRPSSSWAGWRGHVSSSMIREVMWPHTPGAARLALQCGPPGFEKEAALPALLQSGFAPQEIYSV